MVEPWSPGNMEPNEDKILAFEASASGSGLEMLVLGQMLEMKNCFVIRKEDKLRAWDLVADIGGGRLGRTGWSTRDIIKFCLTHSLPMSPNRFESVMNELKSQLCSSSIVMLSILCSTFLFLLVVNIQRVAHGTFSLHLKWLMKPQSSPDNPEELKNVSEPQWETDVEVKPLDLQPLTQRTTRHPLEVVYPGNYQFRLNEPNKCLEMTPFLILLVTTEPKDVAKRNAIRQTWGNESSIPGVSVFCLFLMGVHPNFGSPLQNLLEKESSLYRDIIQQDFLDTYNNLTLKTLMGMEWISKFCPNAAYVMKADSDVFLNVD
ncbi:hypothetical protein lerEdw1_020571 [Lerista edwardsae]|nr:hypothetical protein lerEdw1_020571 [Lerista edwardsae]